MFLEGTLHIFILYIFLGFLLGISVLEGWWESLINFKSKVESEIIPNWVFLALLGLIMLTIVISHLHKFWEVVPFYQFAFMTFLVLPLASASFGVFSFVKNQEKAVLGETFNLMFLFGGLGLAASNLHDIIWCGKTTNLFTIEDLGKNDLDLWVNLLNIPSYDYRILGFYMIIQAVLLLLLSYFTFSSFKDLKGNTYEAAEAWKWGLVGTGLLSLGIVIMDWRWFLSPPWVHTATLSIFILASTFFFYRSGEKLAKARLNERYR